MNRLNSSPASEAFTSRYGYDPKGFVHDCITFPLGDGPTAYQDDILDNFIARKRTAVRGPHGLGKTAVAAWLVLWGVLAAPDVKVITTARSWRQLTKFLWPEVHKWAGRVRWDVVGRPPFVYDREIKKREIEINRGLQYAFAAATSDFAQIEGAHAERIIYILDEARDIPNELWDAIEGAFAGAGVAGRDAYALAISTPRAPVGRFYDIHSGNEKFAHWHAVHVTLEQAMAAGRISQEWVDDMRRQWGEENPVYVNRVEGNFAEDRDKALIPLAWIEASFDRWWEWQEEGFSGDFVRVAADIGRTHDHTVSASRFKGLRFDGIREIRDYGPLDTMRATGKLVQIMRANEPRVTVDVPGIGAGVVDRLRELGYTDVIAFNGSGPTTYTDPSGELLFVNKRAAAYWHLRELLDPANDHNIALPPDDELLRELTVVQWDENSAGRIKLEPKEDIVKKLGRSPDKADAVVMAFWVEGGRRVIFG